MRYFLVSPSGGANLTPAQLEELPPALRDVLGGRGGGFTGGFGGNRNADLTQWVSTHCITIPASQWGGGATSSTGGGFPGGGFFGGARGGNQQLYDCGAAPTV